MKRIIYRTSYWQIKTDITRGDFTYILFMMLFVLPALVYFQPLLFYVFTIAFLFIMILLIIQSKRKEYLVKYELKKGGVKNGKSN